MTGPVWYRYGEFRQRVAWLVRDLIYENEMLRAQLAEKYPPENPVPLLSGEEIIAILNPEQD